MWSRPELAGPAAYTVRDTPEVVARVEDDLARILRTLRRADPALKGLVLTGGFARGEGAVMGGKPQNDYDIVALRGLGQPRVDYADVRAALEARLGLHVDLASAWVGRLRHVRPSIFWYETALRGRMLWGSARWLERIPVRTPERIDRAEGLRLLANRAAGLLLAEPRADPHLHRIQASKGLLAALDAHLLARGTFAPSQRERWGQWQALRAAGGAPPALARREGWLAWAFAFKVDPEGAAEQDAREAWRASAAAILDAVPGALASAGFADAAAWARADHALDNLAYRLRSGRAPGARRWARHPTGQLRAATLAILAEQLHGNADGTDPLRPLLRRPASMDHAAALAALRAVAPS